MYDDAKNETRRTRGAEGQLNQGADHGNSQDGTTSRGGQYGNISQRTARTPGARAIDGNAITGGIIAQLITDAEDRLGKVRGCIEWYQVEEREQLERLDNLRRLQQAAEVAEATSDEESE